MERLFCEDIMVGDWIMYKSDSPENAFPVKITAKMFCNELTKWTERFEYIPLTAEILEKNRFKVINNEMPEPYRFYETDDKRIQVGQLTNNGDGYWNVHVDNEDFNTIGSCDVQYVHEMQHLLKLCKIDKEIEL